MDPVQRIPQADAPVLADFAATNGPANARTQLRILFKGITMDHGFRKNGTCLWGSFCNPGRAASVSHKQGQTHKAFFANEANLHGFSIRLNGQN